MKNIVGAMLMFVGAVFFSAKAVMVKLTYQYEVDAITVLTLRMLFSIPFYIGILFLNRNKLKEANAILSKNDWINVVVMGVLGYYLASIFDFIGLEYISAGLERLILFTYPTLVVVLSAFFLKKKIGKIEYIALGLTYIGIVVVFFDNTIISQKNIGLGTVFVFGSALTYAFYLIGTGQLTPKLGSVNYTALSMIVSALAVFIHYVAVANIGDLFSNIEVIKLTLIMAIFSTVLPSFMIAEGIRLMGSGRASIVASVGPVSTIVLAYFFLNESFSLIQLAGTVLVLVGVLTVSVKKS
ncbi:MAG TPA: DMT family transporter [Cytophagaceae bacterium]|jgi:drug/metabolite transporter (DMT)-like permease|nr:DMT family transporter [Cytophagaceae bacterium]